MMTKGYSPNYEQRLADVKELDISFVYDSQSAQLSHLEHIYDHLKQNDDKGKIRNMFMHKMYLAKSDQQFIILH